MAGSASLCCSIAARNCAVVQVLGDAEVGEGVDVGGLEPVVPRVQVRAGLAAQVRLDRVDVVAELLGVGDGVRLVPGRARWPPHGPVCDTKSLDARDCADRGGIGVVGLGCCCSGGCSGRGG